MHLYLSHLGDVYLADKSLSDMERFCEVCNLSDEYLGQVTSMKDIEIKLHELLDFGRNFHCNMEMMREKLKRNKR